MSAGTCDFTGLNITIYRDESSVLCHEVQHVLGYLFDDINYCDKINEGMTETYSGINQTYDRERYFYIILEQIYGEDFFKEVYYNKKIYMIFLEIIFLKKDIVNTLICILK